MYSVTQGMNFAQISVAIGIIIRIFSEPSSITPDEWQIVGLAFVAVVTSLVSAVNRHGKGDITPLGFRK